MIHLSAHPNARGVTVRIVPESTMCDWCHETFSRGGPFVSWTGYGGLPDGLTSIGEACVSCALEGEVLILLSE